MGYINDLIAEEDKKFLDADNGAEARAKASAKILAMRRRWRDGHGVMHELRPIVAIALNGNFEPQVRWRVLCGYKRRSDVEHDPDAAVTCLACLGHQEPIL